MLRAGHPCVLGQAEKKYKYAGPVFRAVGHAVLSGELGLRAGLRPLVSRRGGFMEFILAGIIAVAVGVYLIYALLRPERF
jgi:K+-transporting ATPase KdpF subunit